MIRLFTYRVFLNAARDELKQHPHEVIPSLPQSAKLLVLQLEHRGHQ